MQMVGATKYFIRYPFIIKNVRLSIISSIIASIALGLLIYYLNQNISILETINTIILFLLFIFIVSPFFGI